MSTAAKRIITLVLTAVLICAVLLVVGCDNGDKPVTKYNVTYVFGNGQDNVVEAIEEGKTAVQPADPTREGYDFKGWHLNNLLYDFSTPITSNITLVAKWEEEPSAIQYKLTWSSNAAAEYIFEGERPRNAYAGDTIKFGLRISPYYTGSATVKAGSSTLTPSAGIYSFVVGGDTTISVAGLSYDDSPISGMGTYTSPYTIQSAAQLKTFADSVNSTTNTKYNSAYIRLDADIDLGGFTWEPIGHTLNDAHFEGIFDGNDHTISNFSIDSDNGIIGFFGYVVEGIVQNLSLVDATIDVELLSNQNYIIGGVVAYSMGSDIFACNFDGGIRIDFSYTDPSVYVGGIVGFAQGYSTDYSATISYCTVTSNITSVGAEALYNVGGIVGALVGTAPSASGAVYNCVYDGKISGRIMLSGGIVGWLRTNSAITNCYTRGEISANSVSGIAEAGALVGLAGNETAITFSYSQAKVSSVGSSLGDASGDLVGAAFIDGYDECDSRQALLYRSYYAEDGTATVGETTYDLTSWADVASLLGWSSTEWDFDGYPSVKLAGADSVEFTLTFDFQGESVTLEGLDGNPLTLSQDELDGKGCLPIYWVYAGDGFNTFKSDAGNISYGYFLDAECTIRVPAATLLAQDMTIYVGFADYSECAGEYYALINDSSVRLVFDDNGKMTMYLDAIVSNRMYVYDGTRIVIKDAYFPHIEYSGYQGVTNANFFAEADSRGLTIYDGYYFTKGNAIVAYKHNDAMGDWYTASGEVYTFRVDGSGAVYNAQGAQTKSFTYTVNASNVRIAMGAQTINATLSADRTSMQSDDIPPLYATRIDEFLGDWESAFASRIMLSFDGRGTVTFGGTDYSYTISDERVLSFDGKTAHFNEDGMLVLTQNGVQTILGRGGSVIGVWVDTYYDYTVEFYGINRYGYGWASDSNGISFTYTAEAYEYTNGDLGYFLSLYYGTTMYGFGDIAKADSEVDLLALGVYTPNLGMILDDYTLCYQDMYIGKWYASNPNDADTDWTFEFNGLGAYDINFEFGGGLWLAQGELTITVGTLSEKIRYSFDKQTGAITFTFGGKQYTGTLADDALTLTAAGISPIGALRPDEFDGLSLIAPDGTRLVFNGKSAVGLGKATLTKDGQATDYDYTIVGGEAVLAGLGSASVDPASGLLVLTQTTGDTTEFGLFSKLVDTTYIGTSSQLIINAPFTISGTASGSYNGIEATFVYLDEEWVALYVYGSLYYFVGWYDEHNILLCDTDFSLVSAMSVADGMAGTYTAQNGDKLILDGRSYNTYFYAYATMVVDGVSDVYVYMTKDGVTTIYQLDRSGESDQLTAIYTISRTQSQGAIAFADQDGNTLYLSQAQ